MAQVKDQAQAAERPDATPLARPISIDGTSDGGTIADDPEPQTNSATAYSVPHGYGRWKSGLVRFEP